MPNIHYSCWPGDSGSSLASHPEALQLLTVFLDEILCSASRVSSLLQDLLCSLQFAFDFEPVSRPYLYLRPWFLTPDWVIIEALLWWTQGHLMAPAGVDLRLCYGSSSNSHSPVRIRSGLRKKQSTGGGQGGSSSVWVSGGQGYRKG